MLTVNRFATSQAWRSSSYAGRIALRQHYPSIWSSIRWASTAKSQKVAVIPYALDPMTAQSRMKIHALLSTITASNAFYAFVLKLFGESLTPILHEFGLGGNNLKFEQTRAVYWPIWKVDFLARTNPSSTSAPVSLLETPALSLSGNSFSPISLLNFALPSLSDEIPIFDPEHDLKQLGEMPISAIPYSVDPIKAKDLARRTLGNSVVLGSQKMDIDKEVEELVFAAYPIYVPLYISEWSFRLTEKSRPRKITIVMTADEDKPDNCFVFKPMIPGYGEKSGNYGYWIEMPRRVEEDPSSSTPTIHSPRDVAKAYIDWLNPPAYDSDLIEGRDPRESSNKPPRSPLQAIDVEEDEIDWDSARIQYWSGKERVESLEWMHLTELKTKMESQLKNIRVLEEKHGNKVGFTGVVRLNKNTDPSAKDKPFIESLGPKDAMKIVEADVKKVTAEWEEKRPAWIKALKRDEGA